jgi:hypothetical protein
MMTSPHLARKRCEDIYIGHIYCHFSSFLELPQKVDHLQTLFFFQLQKTCSVISWNSGCIFLKKVYFKLKSKCKCH